MIVSMKKIHLIVQKKDVVSALETVRDLGVVHVEHQDELTGFQLTERREEVGMLENVLRILRECLDPSSEQKEYTDWTELANQILKYNADIEHSRESMASRQVLIDKWQPWGRFDLSHIAVLEERGVYFTLYEISEKEKVELPQGMSLKTIYKLNGKKYCVAVCREQIDLPFQKIAFPKIGLKPMKVQQEEDQTRIDKAQKFISASTCNIEFLEKTLVARQNVLCFEEVEKGMKEDETLVVLKGFCPEAQCSRIEGMATQENWGLLVEDPSDEDEVPTLLKNAKWVDLSKPVLNVIEILPGYKESDVSAVFLVFFILFFAMLIGDAAYGAIFMAGVFYAQKKFGKSMQDQTVFYLGYILTGFTCLWGIATGTYFGQAWLPSTVKAVVPWLNVTENIQWLCFAVALAHLSLARAWAAKIKFPSITFLSEIGWLMIVWGMYFLANMFVLKKAVPPITNWLFIVGIALAFFFMFPPKEFLKKIGQEVIPFVLGIIGAGTDIVSYIRLFAVGLATVAVADAANAMPADLPGVGYGFMIFLHLLNLVLAAMAILVHAIRLNVLEFSGHLGLEWAGFGFKPFKKK